MGHGMDALAPAVRAAISLIEQNVSEPLGVPEIAAHLGLSRRQLKRDEEKWLPVFLKNHATTRNPERQFKQNIGCTVVQFGLLLRLQHARVLLIATKLSMPLPPTTSTKGSRQGGLNGWPITVRCGVAQSR